MLESSISHTIFQRNSSGQHQGKSTTGGTSFAPLKAINLEKIIQRPKRPNYQAKLLNCETPCDLFVLGDIGQLTSRSDRLENFRVQMQFEIELKSGEYRRLSDMYKWAQIDCFQINFQEDIFEQSCCGQKVDILNIRKKGQSPDVPIIVFSHASQQDLGSVAHFLMDLVSMLKIEIVAYEYPSFSKNERQAKNKKQKFNEEVLLKYMKQVMIFVQQKAYKEPVVRPVFLYGCREGAIPTALIANENEHLVKGIIFQDPLIVIETRRGLFWRQDKRYLSLVSELNSMSFLLFHGMQGKAQPFSNSKAIIEACCGKDVSQKELLKQKEKITRKGIHPTYGNSTVYRSITREGDTIHFQTYFVECKNTEIRVLKRAKFYRKITAFMDDIVMSYQNYTKFSSTDINQTALPNKETTNDYTLQVSDTETRFLDKSNLTHMSSLRRAQISNLAVHNSVKQEDYKNSALSDTFNLSPLSSHQQPEIKFHTTSNTATKTSEQASSPSDSPKRIFDIKPKFKSGIDFTLKKSHTSSPMFKLKGLHKRKLTFDATDIEESFSDEDFSTRINVLDPRSLKTESDNDSPFKSPSEQIFYKE